MSGKATRTIGDSCELKFVDAQKVENARRAMKSAETISLLAKKFKILGYPTRIKIAIAFSREELCVCDIFNLLNVSQLEHKVGILNEKTVHKVIIKDNNRTMRRLKNSLRDLPNFNQYFL